MEFLRKYIGPLLGWGTGLGFVAMWNGRYLIGITLLVAGVTGCAVATVCSYLEYRQKRLKDEPHLPCERPGGL